MSTFEDCQRFLKFVAECFVEKPVIVDQVRLEKLRTTTATHWDLNEFPPIKTADIKKHTVDEKEKPADTSLTGFGHKDGYTLTNIYIYPVKSCAAQEV